jgi:hypothetical protein
VGLRARAPPLLPRPTVRRRPRPRSPPCCPDRPCHGCAEWRRHSSAGRIRNCGGRLRGVRSERVGGRCREKVWQYFRPSEGMALDDDR